MSIFLCSNSAKYIEHWKSIFQESQEVSKEQILKLEGVVVVDYDLYHTLSQQLRLKMVVLDKAPSFERCTSLMEKGVKAYGNVYMHKSHLLSAIESVKENKVWIYPDFTSTLLSMSQKTDANNGFDEKIEELSAREKEVTKLIYKGLTNKEIAIELAITTHTIKNHAKNIYAKIGVNDRLSLFAYLKN